MEKHVPCLKTCQRLKGLGYPHIGNQFYWCTLWNDVRHISLDQEYSWHIERDTKNYVAAPLATELLEWLPEKHAKQELEIWKLNKEYYVNYLRRKVFEPENDLSKNSNNLPEALAQMLIYLVENGIVTLMSTAIVKPDKRNLGKLQYDSSEEKET